MSDAPPTTPASSTRSATTPTASSATSTRSTTSTSPGSRTRSTSSRSTSATRTLTKLETAQRLEGAPTELWRFACEGFLGNLTRDAPGAGREGRGRARGDRRRRDGAVPDAARRDVQRARPRQAAAARGGADPAARRAAEPHLPRGRADRPRRRAQARRAELLRALQALRLPARRARRRVPELLDETERLWEHEGDKLFRARLGIGLAEARPWDVVAAVPRARARQGLSVRPDAARARGDAHATSASTCARRRTSTSTSSARPSKSPRAFCAPIEVPGKVMLVIQPIGGKRRLGGALPRGGPHRALREHERRPADGGDAGSATWRSPRAGRCSCSTSSPSLRG